MNVFSVSLTSNMAPNDARRLLRMEPIDNLDESKRVNNCKNCGAPLPKNNYCEYCRTQY